MKKMLLIIMAITALTTPISANAKDPIRDLEQISNSTVMLYQSKGEKEGVIGSATIICKDTKYYLLTASHVAKEMKDNAKIVFQLNGDKPGIYDLMPNVKNKQVKWKHHPIADIAIIEVEPSNIFLTTLMEDRAFPLEQISSYKDLPSYESDLTFFGYPMVDMEMEHFSTLIFTGYRSSGLITQLRADTKTKSNFYYLNIPSIEGCSGSGVYFSIKKKSIYMAAKMSMMIGIMHGTYSDNTGGKMAAVTPSYYLFDLFKD